MSQKDTNMLLVVDAGNTKTKWAVFDAQNQQVMQNACLNSELASADFPPKQWPLSHAVVGNVAGSTHALMLNNQLTQQGIHVRWASAEAHACGVLNSYQNPKSLGIDRWAALVAAYHAHQTHCIVVNAGTAITVDALTVTSTGATFLGGTISPGLRLMQMALRQNTAQLNPKNGDVRAFPVNTDDAIYNGCLNAALGVIQTQWQHLEGLVKMPPKLLLSGGDAAVLAKNLPEYLVKHHNIVDNLVLVGLMRLGREKA